MEYRQLGSAGVRVSVIGLGTTGFGVAPPVLSNAKAASWSLTPAEMAEVRALLIPASAAGDA